MNFEFREEQKLLADSVRKFALAHLQKDRRFDQRPLRQADAAE